MNLQPPGKKPLAWLKVTQAALSHLPKAGSFACRSALLLIHCLRLSNSLLYFFATLSTELQRCMCVPSSAAPWQGPVILFPSPQPEALFPLVSTHTSRWDSSSPSHPRRDAAASRMLRCGKPAANGERRRE